MSRTSNGKGDIGKLRKTAITIWLFSGFFGVIILMSSSTPTGLYLGWFFLFVSFIVLVIWAMWNIASKADELVGRHAGYTPESGVEMEEPESSHQIKPILKEEMNTKVTEQPLSNGKVLVIGTVLAIVLYWMTTI